MFHVNRFESTREIDRLLRFVTEIRKSDVHSDGKIG